MRRKIGGDSGVDIEDLVLQMKVSKSYADASERTGVFFWNVLNVWKSSHLNTLLKQFLCSKWKRSSWSVARRLSCWMVSNFIIADVAMKRLPMNICMYLPLIKSCHVYGLLTSIYLQAVDLFCMWYESYRTVASTVLEFRECRGILPKW